MIQPSRKDRMRPAELVGFSAVLALFAGIIVLLSTRELGLAVIFFGIAFIVSLLVVAMLLLAMKPNKDDTPRHDTSGH
ncbi:MAG: hypothetical protein ABWX59_10350 [Microbacteriaceae bacterium]